MLKVYVRRYDGTTQPVTIHHAGQHLGVHEGKVRFVRLFWDRVEPKTDAEERGYDVLLESVPLLDTLIVTRVAPNRVERAVFHGTLTEVSTDERSVSVMAMDNPATERLYDQPWWNDAPLYPSDQAAPEQPAPFPSAGPQGQQPLTLAGMPLGAQAVRPVGAGHLRVSASPGSDNPAARPGGHPAAPPAGQWQGVPQPAPQQA